MTADRSSYWTRLSQDLARAERNLQSAQAEPEWPALMSVVARAGRVMSCRPGRMIGGLSGLAVALITAVTLILTAGSAPALAGWNPVPTHPANAGQISAALRSCDSGTPVLVDTRGPYTAAVYPKAAGASVCLTGAAIHAVGSAQSISNTDGPQARAVQVYTNTFASGKTEETVVYGRVGSAVQGVELVLNHGPNVQATVSQGWYLAWWPGHLHTTALVVDSDHGNAQTPLRGIGPSGKCPPGAGCFSFRLSR